MKIKHITNACAIYEADNGFRLLSDPWLTEPIFDGAWYHDPPIKTKPADVLGVDALYVSHIHPDHCDEGTLRHFRRDIPIFTLQDRLSLCAKHLEKMGFTRIVAVPDHNAAYIGPFRLVMFGPFVKHPHHDAEIGNVVDSALLIEADDQTVLNTNDNTPSHEAALCYYARYGAPTVAQLNWNNAGPYPACFMNLTPAERLAEAERCIERNLQHMLSVACALRPRVVQPFAGAYRLGGNLEHLNKYLGTTTSTVAKKFLEDHGLKSWAPKENEELDLAKL